MVAYFILSLLCLTIALIISLFPAYVDSHINTRISGSDRHDRLINRWLALSTIILFAPLLVVVISRNNGLLLGGFICLASVFYNLIKSFVHLCDRRSIRPLHCQKCRKRLKKLKPVADFLNPKEQVAQQIGSIHFEAWQCQHCQQVATRRSIHLRGYLNESKEFDRCESCIELTMKRESYEVLEEATSDKEGKSLSTYRCHHCSRTHQRLDTIPKFYSGL